MQSSCEFNTSVSHSIYIANCESDILIIGKKLNVQIRDRAGHPLTIVRKFY